MMLINNRFITLKLLGEGAFGILYLVEDVEDGKKYALKILKYEGNPLLSKDERSESQQSIEKRFIREFEICQEIDNPHVIKTYELFRYDGQLAYTMEYIEGSDLTVFRDKIDGKLPPKLSHKHIEILAYRILDGMRAIHERGEIHRDLKHENILVNMHGKRDPREWDLKIIDLGLAKSIDDQLKLTAPGTVLCTKYYAPPEYLNQRLWAREGNYIPRIDIFAFGVILLELFVGGQVDVVGINPYNASSTYKLLPLDKSSLRDIPSKYLNIILKCIHEDPEKRYLKASHILDDLNRPASEFSSAAIKHFKSKWTFAPSPRLMHAFSIVLVVALLMVIGVAAFWNF